MEKRKKDCLSSNIKTIEDQSDACSGCQNAKCAKQKQDYQSENRNLKTENEALRSKLNGYRTLAELYEGSQHELKRVQKDVEFLHEEKLTLIQQLEKENQVLKLTQSSHPLNLSKKAFHIHSENNAEVSLHSNNDIQEDSSPDTSIDSNTNSFPTGNNYSTEGLQKQSHEHESSVPTSLLSMPSMDIQEAAKNITGNSDVSRYVQEATKTAVYINKLEKQNKTLKTLVNLRAREFEQKSHCGSMTDSNGWIKIDPAPGIHELKNTKDEDQTEVVKAIPANIPSEQIHRMRNHIQELMDANSKWDEHCKKQQEEHAAQFDLINHEKNELLRKISEIKVNEEKRQAETDKVLLSAKKKVTDFESEKEDALQELHIEKRRSANLQERVSQLEQQQQNVTQQRSHFHNVKSTMAGPVNISERTIEELKEQILVLQQQNVTFQEDFEIERRDRERSQQLKEQFKQQLENARIDKVTAEQDLEQSKQEIRRLKNLTEQISYELHALEREAELLRRQLREARMNEAPGHWVSPSVPEVLPPVCKPWSCRFCTFQNHGRRTICEICGKEGRTYQGGYERSPILYADHMKSPGLTSRGIDVPDDDQPAEHRFQIDSARVGGFNMCDDLTTDSGQRTEDSI